MSEGTAGHGRKSLAKIKDETKFYGHQIEGVRDMARRTSFLLADEMGLGKSLQSLAVAAIDYERGWAARTLVVCPATLKGNWADEVVKFTSFSYMVLDGSPKQRAVQLDEFITNGIEVLIVNYEQVKPHLDALNKMGFDIAIFDEAHYIKNRGAHRTKACHQLRCKRAFVLTGSPLLNKVDDLWGLLHRVDPARWPNYWRFINRYAIFGGYKDKQIVGTKNREELRAEVESVMIRRLKKDVLDLPDKQHITIHVDFHPVQAKYYQQAEDELKIDLPDVPSPMEIENVLTKLLRLKQICGTPYAIGAEDESFKLDRAVEMIQEMIENDEKVVVFTQFRGVLEAMEKRLADAGIEVHQLHGDVKKELRQPIVHAWSAGGPAVMLAMLQVGGTGLNMVAASKCIFLDKLWTPKLNEQAEDRLHRIGASLTQPIQIYEIVVRKSVEQRIEKILKGKEKLFTSLIEESAWKKKLIASLMEDMEDEDDE